MTDKEKEIWRLARNAIYDLEQAEVNEVRAKLRKIIELVRKDDSKRP